MILRKGIVVEMGDTERVFANPLHPYTKSLLASVPQLHTRWQDVEAPAALPAELDAGELVEAEAGHLVAAAGAPPRDRDPVGGAAAGSHDVLWRSSRNPIVTRDAVPHANSIFNSAVVQFGNGFAGVFRVDDTRRVMNVHAGRSADGVHWEIDASRSRSAG